MNSYLKAGSAASLADAQFQIARLYEFANWPKLKAHVESFGEVGQLKQAIDTNDIARVQPMMTRNPALHRAPLGYGKDVAAHVGCRMPCALEAPESREASHGGMDDHAWVGRAPRDDGPLMRAALNAYRIPMMGLLVSRGADVNALWHGHFPIIFAPCESLDPAALKWLLDHGANPNCRDYGYETGGHAYPGTALDSLRVTRVPWNG